MLYADGNRRNPACSQPYNVLNNVRSISAAAGSTLKFEGSTAPVVSGLKVDAAGIGTILMFWGVAEPLPAFYSTEPKGLVIFVR